jgi:NAD(P)-dependent dehydrogenase (short-subunit alcohol dehydrogenase family)
MWWCEEFIDAFNTHKVEPMLAITSPNVKWEDVLRAHRIRGPRRHQEHGRAHPHGCPGLQVHLSRRDKERQRLRSRVGELARESPFELTRLAMPHMLERGGGSIVNIGSMAGLMAERGFISYSLSKSALGQLTRLLAVELAPRIRVRGIPRRHRDGGIPRLPRHRAACPRVHARQNADAAQRNTCRHRGRGDVLRIAGVVLGDGQAPGSRRRGTPGLFPPNIPIYKGVMEWTRRSQKP